MILQGTAGPITGRKRYGFSPQRGFYTGEVKTGTAANIHALLPALVASGTPYDVIETDGGLCRLEIQYSNDRVTNQNPGETAVVNTWELYNNMVVKSILDADTVAVRSLAKADLEALSDYEKTGVKPSGLSGTALAFQELIASKNSSMEVRAAIIRHTQTVSSSYATKNAMTYAGRIMKLATLKTEGVPAAILWNIDNFDAGTSAVTRTGFDASNTFYYGWLKSFPNVTQQTVNTWQIQTEYKYGLYSTILYQAIV